MRYTTRPFPDYRHRLGITPHPERDAAGHAHGRVRPEARVLSRSNWSTHEGYLYGIDLFNAGYYWEAHVEWEELWQLATERSSRLFLQGLIQLAASLVKMRQCSWTGVAKLLKRASEKFEPVYRDVDKAFGLRRIDLEATTVGLSRCAATQDPGDDVPVLVVHR